MLSKEGKLATQISQHRRRRSGTADDASARLSSLLLERGRSVNARAGASLFDLEESAVLLVVMGTVSLRMFSDLATEVILNNFEQSEMFVNVFMDGGLFYTRICPESSTTLITMSERQVRREMEADDEVTDYLDGLVDKSRLGWLRTFHQLIFLPVAQRLYCEVLRRSATATGTARFRMPTHQQLATRIASSREAVSRELSFLKKEGVIEDSDDGDCVVLNPIFLLRRIKVALGADSDEAVRAFIGVG